VAIAAGASFVARGFAGDVEHLVRLMKLGIKHKGFALIDILQPCISFNHKNTYAWYRERVYRLEDEVDYNPGDKLTAFNKAQEWDDKIPIGVIYLKGAPTFEEQLPALAGVPLVKQAIEPQKVEVLLNELL